MAKASKPRKAATDPGLSPPPAVTFDQPIGEFLASSQPKPVEVRVKRAPRRTKEGVGAIPTTHTPRASKALHRASKAAPAPPKCYLSHPPYPVAPGFAVWGGSCYDPGQPDFDVLVGLDAGHRPGWRAWPWYEDQHAFTFPIVNNMPPDDVVSFRALIIWLTGQVLDGRKVHVGCIGGHGRTGLVFAALRKHMTGDDDAIAHVRAHYCKKAVETAAQVRWLVTHWGVTHAPGSAAAATFAQPTKLFPFDEL